MLLMIMLFVSDLLHQIIVLCVRCDQLANSGNQFRWRGWCKGTDALCLKPKTKLHLRCHCKQSKTNLKLSWTTLAVESIVNSRSGCKAPIVSCMQRIDWAVDTCKFHAQNICHLPDCFNAVGASPLLVACIRKHDRVLSQSSASS